jgi:hypothetical protein
VKLTLLPTTSLPRAEKKTAELKLKSTINLIFLLNWSLNY